MSRRADAAVLLLAAVAVAGCGEAADGDPVLPQDAAAAAQVELVDVPGLGPVLADGDGFVLYMFPPDARARVTCTGPCAGSWPPLAVADGVTPVAGDGIDPELLSTLPDPNTGGHVVTYGGYPLYRYASDVDPGTAYGQALLLNGAPWYVLDAAGQPLTTDPEATP
ncbi:lipoprotein [Blastococcus saxobsidens]|uniref:Putative lipoprotein n=1 Tax=Blastococcus saxobsidens (strain DD2) TaxID=1146883 RepID=H6RRL5_BLASD|nr:lipoprotein [Blastococcus saxobsidens]CCG01658.1 putative lipoprotein [Blastococcus saxobsidens DD2]